MVENMRASEELMAGVWVYGQLVLLVSRTEDREKWRRFGESWFNST